MRLVPKFISDHAERLIGRAPERYRRYLRRLAAVLAIAFVAFELSRFAVMAEELAPLWVRSAALFENIRSLSPLGMIVGLTVALIAFVLPMAGIIWLGRLVLKRSS